MTVKVLRFTKRYLPNLNDSILVEMPDGTHKSFFCDGFEVMGSINLVTLRIPVLFGEGNHCFYDHANLGDTVKISVSRSGYVRRIRPV